MPRARSPRQKTLLIFLVTIISIAVIITSLSYYLILGSFASLEEEQSRSDMAVILNTIAEQGQALNSSVKLLGSNDDTYEFLSDNSSLFINTTVGNKKFDELQLNFLIIYNRTGDLFYSKGYNLATAQETAVPPAITQFFSEKGMFSSASSLNFTYGIVRMEDTAILMAASPITTKDQSGLSRGTLIIGRYMDAAYIQKLSSITSRPLEIGFIGDPEMPANMRDAEYNFRANSASLIVVHPLNTTTVASFAQVNDVTGTPTLILETERSREIFTKGLAAVEFFVLILAAITIVFVFFGYRFIDNAFTQLDKNIEQFATLGDHIRNPLTVIIGLADLHESEVSEKIIEQARIIDDIINRLDTGWIESEKIKDFLRKYSKK
jgi:sensor domain CHASE-containing protein